MIIIPKDQLPPESNNFSVKQDIQALSQRNMQNLMKTLSDKTVQKSVEALSKLGKNEWVALALVTTNLRDIVEMGGLGVFSDMADNIFDTVKLKIESLTSPIVNEVTAAIDEALLPFIQWLTPLMNGIGDFVADNETAGIGGIVGGIVGTLFGQPFLGAIAGAVLAALLEAGLGASQEALDEITGGTVTVADAFAPSGSGFQFNWLSALRQINATQTPTYTPKHTYHKGVEE